MKNKAAFCLCCIAASFTAISAGAAERNLPSLLNLSLEELSRIEVTSVSGRAEPLSQAPASIYVITGEEILRSGVTSLPEALRLAPNLQVARIDASSYAISARGFNNSIGNKLLVLVDGRTIYTPLFSGVFWDQQDLVLEDIERIEVISGPGATLWGANAVNGVINVTTKRAQATQGLLVSAAAGPEESVASMRFGGAVGNGHYRVYAKRTERENFQALGGAQRFDGRENLQAGFRADWAAGSDEFTLQGDTYVASGEDPGMAVGLTLGRYEASGTNLLGRWTRRLGSGSDLRLQAYVDTMKRRDRVLFQPNSDIFDLEAQHSFRWGEQHHLLWGGGYRKGRDSVEDGVLAGMRPRGRELTWLNLFVQDEYRISPELALTAGLKLEHNTYSGMDHLPSVRLAWTPRAGSLIWASASRAVRAPSRFDRDVTVPFLPGFSLGGPNFQSEVANVVELGYRAQPSRAFSYSVTLFHHDWDRLRSGTPPPLVLENRIQGAVHGMEAWGSWQATSNWRLSGGITTLNKRLQLEPGSTDPVGVNNVTLGNDPDYQWTLRSSWDIASNHQLDVSVRRVADLPVPLVEAYTAVDVRYGWKVRPDLEVTLTAQNALDARHAEFHTSAAVPIEVKRSVLLGVRWGY